MNPVQVFLVALSLAVVLALGALMCAAFGVAAQPESPEARLLNGQSSFETEAEVMAVAAGCVNLHLRPDRSSAVLTCLPEGERARITGGPSGSRGEVWWRVEASRGAGYAEQANLIRVPY
jgi:hypothetical protein